MALEALPLLFSVALVVASTRKLQMSEPTFRAKTSTAWRRMIPATPHASLIMLEITLATLLAWALIFHAREDRRALVRSLRQTGVLMADGGAVVAPPRRRDDHLGVGGSIATTATGRGGERGAGEDAAPPRQMGRSHPALGAR